jgi:hypothetical protein
MNASRSFVAGFVAVVVCLSGIAYAAEDDEVQQLREEVERLSAEVEALREEIRELTDDIRSLRGGKPDRAVSSWDERDERVDDEVESGEPLDPKLKLAQIRSRSSSKKKLDPIDEYIEANPDLDAKIVQAMRKGDVVVGMPLEAAELSLKSRGRKLLEATKYQAMRYRVNFRTLRPSDFSRELGRRRTYAAEVEVLTQRGDLVKTKAAEVIEVQVDADDVITVVAWRDILAQVR